MLIHATSLLLFAVTCSGIMQMLLSFFFCQQRVQKYSKCDFVQATIIMQDLTFSQQC
jgi:hypothetical protein